MQIQNENATRDKKTCRHITGRCHNSFGKKFPFPPVLITIDTYAVVAFLMISITPTNTASISLEKKNKVWLMQEGKAFFFFFSSHSTFIPLPRHLVTTFSHTYTLRLIRCSIDIARGIVRMDTRSSNLTSGTGLRVTEWNLKVIVILDGAQIQRCIL